MAKSIGWRKWFFGCISLCILVWMTWFFGYTYIRMVTQPKNLIQPSPSEQKQNDTQINLSGLDFWTCQIGVFNTEENAYQEKNRLEQLGWEAQIINKNPWIVGIGFAHSQEELKLVRERLKEGGILSVPKNIKIPERAYRIRGAGAEQTAQLLQAVHTYLKTPLSSRETILSQFEKVLVMPNPKPLTGLQDAGLTVLKAERMLQEDSRRIITLRLLAQYQATLDTLQK